MRLTAIITIILITKSICLLGQMDGKTLLKRSVAYHDPQEKLMKREAIFHLNESRTNAADRTSIVTVNPKKQRFNLVRTVDGVQSTITLEKEKIALRIVNITGSDVVKNDMTPERIRNMKNYYEYLWYMPVKLNDPGTIIGDKIIKTDFFGKTALQMKVTYEDYVGHDIWYFYFDPSTYALIGYRFYHDEGANDGEYVLLDGESESNGVRIPKVRQWYTHKEGKLLGTDTLTKLEVK